MNVERSARTVIPLDGMWCFLHATGRGERRIRVPGVWQDQFDDLRLTAGTARYTRDVEVPAAVGGRRAWLCFGAVEESCTVFVNGHDVGRHEGGYLPFELDVTDRLRPGAANTVTIEVADAESDRFDETPHGKQSWYGPIGGIWQSVRLEARPEAFVRRARVTADHTGAARIDVAVAGGVKRVRCEVRAPDARTWAAEGDPAETLTIDVDRPARWSPDAPHLYRLTVHAGEDVWQDEFGFRSVRAEGGRVLLNDEPVYLLGALDQEYYLPGIATPPSDELLRLQAVRAKELGVNLLRCHIKVPDPRYLRWADRLGLLLWCELPNWRVLGDDARRRARETLAGMVERDFNRPSIVIWTIVNESWGIDLAGDAEHRAWLAETWSWAKRLDPTRLWVDNSACVGNFHVRSDLNDFHFYAAVPDGARTWTEWTAAWIAEPQGTWSPHGDADARGDEPMVLSEFGCWGLPDVDRLTDEHGRDPWWFATGQDWSGGVVHPAGVRERFAEWGLDEVFGSWAGFVAASQEQEFDGLAYQIRDIRSHPEIAGYVITEFTDVHWECNGLLDMRRDPKAFHDRFHTVNRARPVVPLAERTRFAAGDTAVVRVLAPGRDGERLRWWCDALGVAGDVAAPGVVELPVPELHAPRRVVLTVEDAELPLLLLPAEPACREDVPVVARLQDAADHLDRGGRAVVVATDEASLPDGVGVRVQRRAGSLWHGDWAQGMGWLHPRLTGGLDIGPRVDLGFVGLVPDHVLLGYESTDRADVHAGSYVGWLQANAALVAGFRHGAGAGIVTTFPLLGEPAGDPLGRLLRARLTEMAADPAFAPAKKLRAAG
jgi:hypothetical protein